MKEKKMLTIYDSEKEEYQEVEEPDPSYGYTYADYIEWKFLERLELIKGRVFRLSAPTTNHMAVAGELYLQFRKFLKQNPCVVFIAPFDVCLPKNGKTADNEITTVVQPDVGVICNESKILPGCCCGAPDLVVEVLSPSNKDHDVHTKYQLYEEAGSLEYWIVDPVREKLVVYVLSKEGKYGEGKMYSGKEVITSVAVSGFSIRAADIFGYKIRIKKGPGL
jgi:Uma2 family endonuclease